MGGPLLLCQKERWQAATVPLGVFTFNMVHAPGESSGLPTSYSTVQGSSVEGEEAKRDNNWPSIIHALYLCGALILLFLFGAILFRVFPKSMR